MSRRGRTQPPPAQQPLSRHAGFFASLHRVEERLALEQPHRQHEAEEQPPPPPQIRTRQPSSEAPPPLTGTMSGTPLLLLDLDPAHRHTSSGPALDFLTLSKDAEAEAEAEEQHPPQADADDEQEDTDTDIARLMALLGLSPPPPPPPPVGVGDGDDDDGCECSGGEGFLGKVVGVVGPKCGKERSRLDAWIRHYHATATEPARLAHLLLAKAASSSAAAAAPAFPAAVKGFLQRDPPTLHPDRR
ncbi:hypothetical protein ACP4OV_020767 [Aristida adscensionis]